MPIADPIPKARMTGVKDRVYEPIPENVAVYKRLYALYKQLHDAFGTEENCDDGCPAFATEVR